MPLVSTVRTLVCELTRATLGSVRLSHQPVRAWETGSVGSWDEAQAMVGQVIGRSHGPDPVSAADIRRKLEAIGFDCPLHYDEATAREHGYRTMVAPVSMTRAWSLPAYWS